MICGAGIAGLALAHRLGTLGWDVVVLEKAPGPRTQGYMTDFFGPGYDAAEAMGVLPRLHELGYDVQEVRYLDETGRRRARLRFAQFAKAVHGRLLSIMRPDLERALREQLPDTVDLRFATNLSHVDNGTDGVRPRYHQWHAVRELTGHAARHGAGQNYLVQHSAGSGKSNTIA